MLQDSMGDEKPPLGRSTELDGGGEARTTLAWFLAKVKEEGSLEGDWRATRERMAAVNSRTGIVRLVTVDHDFWLCKRANPAPVPPGALDLTSPQYGSWSIQVWQPPAEWDRWPTFGAEAEDWLAGRDTRSTRAMEAPAEANVAGAGSAAARIVGQLQREAPNPVAETLLTQSAAWLDVALGRLGRIRAPDGDVEPGTLLQDLGGHVLSKHSTVRADMMEDSLELLYGSIRSLDGTRLLPQPSLRGQSSEWRDYFRALGRDVSREHALLSVQLAALLLRSEPVWRTLAALRLWDREGAEDLRDFATCVRRRWCLALRALAWLEISLVRARPFETLRPADLTCFAVASLLPLYPRALVAVSHRSRDAKKSLLDGTAWGSNEVLFDATFRPEWQTNRAMIWSLFASTPVLCKLRSPGYDESRWCRAEAEMFDHLLHAADFLVGRRYVELDIEESRALDGAARSHPATHRLVDTAAGLESPPFEIRRWMPWQGAMVRAVAVARFVYRLLATGGLTHERPLADLANAVLAKLFDEGELPEESLFGFDHLWQRLAAGLRADAAAMELPGPLATVAAEEDDAAVQAWFRRLAECSPDSAGGGLDLCDLLAALDWREHLEHHLRMSTEGTAFEYQAGIIDLRGVTEAEWMTSPGWTVARGLIFLRLPYPLLVRQLAGQGVDGWPLIRELDLPIFTQHAPQQRLPQSEVFFSLGGPWPAVYFGAVSDAVQLSPYLVYACRESLKEGPDPVMVRFEKPLASFPLGLGLLAWLEQRRDADEG